ncbi:MAG: hypothetical protein ACHQRM_05855 [Bacteroidia bacterium]
MKVKVQFLALILVIIACGCKRKETANNTVVTPPGPDINNTFGYGILKKVSGIWNGPVTSTTPLGGYPQWIVDFRPNSDNQVSAKNELDTLNKIFMSFFIVKHNNQYKVAFRNGGNFNGMQRVSYFVADSVSETGTSCFYRFSEAVKGMRRAYATVIFRADSMYLFTYTNKGNTLPSTTPHMTWSAKLQDTTSAAPAIAHFGFPVKHMTMDFSSVFSSVAEAIYFASSGPPAGEPYPDTVQPYLGKTTASFTYAASYTPSSSKKVLLIITTQPLFSGTTFVSANLKYRSRYVILNSTDTSYTFTLMHPGTYYYYALYDTNGTGVYGSGDWISLSNASFTLAPLGTATVSTQINFTIP